VLLQPGATYLLRTLDILSHWKVNVRLHERYHQLPTVLVFLRQWMADPAAVDGHPSISLAFPSFSRSFEEMLQTCELSALNLVDVGPLHNIGDDRDWSGLEKLLGELQSSGLVSAQQVGPHHPAAARRGSGVQLRSVRLVLVGSAGS
jgi:hypothetical protein